MSWSTNSAAYNRKILKSSPSKLGNTLLPLTQILTTILTPMYAPCITSTFTSLTKSILLKIVRGVTEEPPCFKGF